MIDNELLTGRPYGGVTLIWHSKLNNMASPYKKFSQRCCAIRVVMNDVAYAFICVYFPTDNYTDNPSQELIDTLDSLELFIHSLDVDHVIVGGDLNTDFARLNGQSYFVSEFCEHVTVKPCVNVVKTDFSFTRSHGANASYIDHFFISSSIASSKYCSNLLLFDDNTVGEVNLSDHSAIPVCITLPAMCKLPPCNVPASDQAHSVWWSKATTEQLANYKQCLCDKLAVFAMTELCDCRGCTSPVHLHAIDNCAARLQATLIECSHACIPRKRAALSKKCVAGWNSECSDLRKQSIAWHNMWIQAGRPNTDVIANIMRATRKKYHLASKQVLRSQNDLRNANIANAHYTSSYDFWSEVKRANACNA